MRSSEVQACATVSPSKRKEINEAVMPGTLAAQIESKFIRDKRLTLPYEAEYGHNIRIAALL
jgi:hypothetical protein